MGNESRRLWILTRITRLFPFQRLGVRVGTSDNKSKMSDFLLHLNKAYKIPSTVRTIRLVYLTNMSLVDTFHVVETAHLHKYRPPLRFPPTVNKCDTMKRNHYLYKQVSFVTSCRLAHWTALGTLTDSSTTALSHRLRQQAPCIITIIDAFLRHISRGNPALQDIPGYFLVKNTK